MRNKTSGSLPRLSQLLPAAGLIAVAGLAWVGLVSDRNNAEKRSFSAATMAEGSAMRVFLDPATGKLRSPMRSELRVMRETAAEVSPEPIRVEHRADGSMLVSVPREKRTRLQARIGAEGELRLSHGRPAGHE